MCVCVGGWCRLLRTPAIIQQTTVAYYVCSTRTFLSHLILFLGTNVCFVPVIETKLLDQITNYSDLRLQMRQNGDCEYSNALHV